MPREIVAADEHQKLDVAWGWDPATQWAATVSVESADGKTGTTVGLGWGDLERLNRAVRRAMKAHRKGVVEQLWLAARRFRALMHLGPNLRRLASAQASDSIRRR